MTAGAKDDFEIPDPAPEITGTSNLAKEASRSTAALELAAFESGSLTPRQAHADWRLRFWLRTVFFFFALCINLWWDYNVRGMLWQSGRSNTGFHLDNAVLIALLTTSIANFLALLTIIARHLFEGKPNQETAK